MSQFKLQEQIRVIISIVSLNGDTVLTVMANPNSCSSTCFYLKMSAYHM